jgi:hypothetical protein
MGKRMILRVFDKLYQSSNSYNNWPSLFPAYLNTAGKLFLSNNRDLQWFRWDSTATGWYINLFQAYAAEFDGDPYFEMIVPFQESAVNTLNPDRTIPGDAEAQTNTSFRTLAAGIKAAWPNTNVWMPINWSPYGSLASYTEYLRSIKVGTGNPDVSPIYQEEVGMKIDQINRGAIGWGGVAAKDYRGVMPMFMAVESSTLGYNSVGPTGGFTALMYAAAYNRAEAVKLLLQRGADATVTTKLVDLQLDHFRVDNVISVKEFNQFSGRMAERRIRSGTLPGVRLCYDLNAVPFVPLKNV